MPGDGGHAARNAAARDGSQGRSELRGPTDAFALGESSPEHFCAVFGDRNAVYAGRRHGPSVALFPEIPAGSPAGTAVNTKTESAPHTTRGAHRFSAQREH